MCWLVKPLQSQITTLKIKWKGQSVYCAFKYFLAFCLNFCYHLWPWTLFCLFFPLHPYANLLFLSVECCEAYERPTSVHYAAGISALPLFVYLKARNTMTLSFPSVHFKNPPITFVLRLKNVLTSSIPKVSVLINSCFWSSAGQSGEIQVQ